MGTFYINTGLFDQQLGLLQQASEHFQNAKGRFYSSVKATVEAWTDLGEIDQFHQPLHGSLLTINDELGATSERFTRNILVLQKALLDIEELDAGQRQRYMDALARLTDRFSYTPPAEVVKIMSFCKAAASLTGTNVDIQTPMGDNGAGDSDSSGGDTRADTNRARAYENARRARGHS